jgi:outer membrane biosynthesis protein TonB
MNETREAGANLPPSPSPPESRTAVDDEGGRNPLLRGLVWALVAIGVLGFGIWTAQKYLFNNGDDKPAPISESKPSPTPPQTPTSVRPVREKPSPMSPPAPQQSVPMPTDQQQNPDSRTRTDAPQKQPESDPTVAFVTDPPGATVTVDMQSELSCRTPCMLTLTTGRHVLKAQLDGYRDYPKIITVPQDNDLFMKLNKAWGSLVLP